MQNLRIRSLCERLPGTQNFRTRLLGAQIQVLCDGEDQDAPSAELDFVFQRFGKIGGVRIPVNQGVREQVLNGARGEGENGNLFCHAVLTQKAPDCARVAHAVVAGDHAVKTRVVPISEGAVLLYLFFQKGSGSGDEASCGSGIKILNFAAPAGEAVGNERDDTS